MRIRLDLEKTPFNLDYTLQCGQVFRWQKQGAWWNGIVKNKTIKMRQMGDVLEFNGVDADFIKLHFRLDDQLPAITSEISRDEFIRSAVQAFPGLRLIRQDQWECLISYICASFNNIPRIKKIIDNLARRFGKEHCSNGVSFYAFPTPESLVNTRLKVLRSCNLGFRAEMVLETAKMINSETVRLADLERLNYEEAKEELMKLPGVGDKVADCVLLFSLNKLEAFPVDVWIRKSILTHYYAHFDGALDRETQRKSLTAYEYRRIGTWARAYFGEYAGYSQQYLYHYERSICDRV